MRLRGRLSVHRQLWHRQLRSSLFTLHNNSHHHLCSLSQNKPPPPLLSLPLALKLPSLFTLHSHAAPPPPPMAPSEVGVLIPLNKSFEEDDSAPKLPVFEGDNVIGRENVSVTDKRLSREHLTLSASPHDASAQLLVEGMNPVVIHSDGQKRKLNSGERTTIKNGDIIELIPGSHYFKYVTQSDQRNAAMDRKESGGDTECKIVQAGSKRTREESNSGVSAVHSPAKHRSEMKVKEESSMVRNSENTESKRSTVSTSGNSEEALCHFRIPDHKVPLTFRLMKVQGLPEWANTSCVSIDVVIKLSPARSCFL